MDETHTRTKRSPSETHAWILGSGTPSLASAVYLVQRAKLPPGNVHILDSHISMGAALHDMGDSSHGYDQFAGCLPIPAGAPLNELLGSIPSGRDSDPTVLEEIQKAEASHMPANPHHRTKFILQKTNSKENLQLNKLGLSIKSRVDLALLMIRSEKRLGRNQISDFMPKNFFESMFWITWAAQFGFQPWHSAIEFRRTLRQYLKQYPHLSILKCMDITGHYQNESIFRPIYLYLYNLGVDFLFDTKVTDIVVTAARDGRQRVSRLSLIANGFQITKEIDTQDIVIMMLGSTVSGSSSGTNSHHPVSKPIEPADELDENWALWLELETNQLTFGNPYNFCTRLNESILASFTITTADSSLWEFLVSIADHSAAGTMIMLQESNWKLRLCIPTQPVFSQQPRDTYVIWGFMLFPRRKGNYVQKLMEQCSGAEILTEVLGHLGYPTLVHHTMTIPRLMPRMTSMLLVRSMTDRPEIVPANSLNFGFIGQFVEIPRYSSVDISYGIRTAQVATSRLMGIPLPKNAHDDLASTPMNLLRLFYWK